MKKRQLLFLLILLVLSYNGIAQQNYTISGYIRSSENGEALIGATIQITELYKGALLIPIQILVMAHLAILAHIL